MSGPAVELEALLAGARQLLASDPAKAAELAVTARQRAPGHPLARLIEGSARRILGDTPAALELLLPLAAEQAHSGPVLLEAGIALGEAGRGAESLVALKRACQLIPGSPDAWRCLADQLDLAGEAEAADQARARYLQAAVRDPVLAAAAAALVANDLPVADARLVAHLSTHPTDVAALRMRAEVAARLRRYVDAEALLARCLALAPSFDAARHNYAMVLNRQGKAAAALPEVERLLGREPRNPGYRNLKAAVLSHLGEYGRAIEVYESVLKDFPRQPKVWMSYGHSLKTAGRQADSIAAYRRALAQEPTLGEAWWSLANLKTFRFTAADRATLEALSGRPELDAEDRVHFEFALGKALEDVGDYAASFAHYAAGNALHRATHPYSAEENSSYVASCKSLYTRDFFAARAGLGSTAPDPIFIVGLPRAGSTLIEQILASHSAVEGTVEMPDIPQLVVELLSGADPNPQLSEAERLAARIAGLDGRALVALAERYLAGARVYRKTGAPLFIDKMPNNWLYVGLIRLILPNARIIDARRHPLGCGFSVFKQHFARGQTFSYALSDIGRYYRDYVELMAHFEVALPGFVHRVHYEAVVGDTEAEVRRLLDFCGLPFEARCLKFYENDRAVRTASSEQVRRPIFRDGLDQWRHFEAWLAPLKGALGTVLDAYPAVPTHFDN